MLNLGIIYVWNIPNVRSRDWYKECSNLLLLHVFACVNILLTLIPPSFRLWNSYYGSHFVYEVVSIRRWNWTSYLQVWHRRMFQPSGLFAARVDLQGSISVCVLLLYEIFFRLLLYSWTHPGCTSRDCMRFSPEKIILGRLGSMQMLLVFLMSLLSVEMELS